MAEKRFDTTAMCSEVSEKLMSTSIAELRDQFLVRRRAVPLGLLNALEADPRHGARELARLIRDRRRKNRAEGQRLHSLLQYELPLWAEGFTLIAGVDEAGMAPLAGPVVAAAVILPKGYKLKGLDDSKKVLDERTRETLAACIQRDAVTYSVGMAEVYEIDRINIYHAGLLAMRRAVCALNPTPDYILVDARRIPDCNAPQRGIVRGDQLSASIAAASIIAKTTRDPLMAELDRVYPGYGFASHKGYPTPDHCRALDQLGPTPVHRRSFAPVRRALGLDTPLFSACEGADNDAEKETWANHA